MPITPRLTRPLLILATLTALTACTEPQSELEGWVATTLRKDPPPLDQIPALKQFPVVLYPRDGLRDPFASGEEALTAQAEGPSGADDPDCPDLTRIPEDLEKFPIDALDMVGTMGQGTNYYGLIKDPEGLVHRVQVNNYLGQNYGQILSVAEGKIEVEERVKDGSGCERRTQAIALDDNN
jgi:type IV pilus assembly protein PilP